MKTTPLKAIKKKCFDCSGDSYKEVSLCLVTDCAIYPYRFGKNPFAKPSRPPSEKQLATLKKGRERK